MNKIVFVTPSLKTGGGNRVFFELSNCMIKKYGCEVEILYPNNSDERNTFNMDSRIHIRAVGKKGNSSIQKICNIKKTIGFINKNFAAIPVIISDPIFCLFISEIKRKECVYRFVQADDYCIFDDNHVFHNIMVKKFYKYLCRKSYKVRVQYIFNSKFTYDAFVSVSGRKDVPYKLVYPAIDHSCFFNRHNPVREQKNSICVVGRRHKLKGLATFQFALEQMPFSIMREISSIYIISHDDLSEFNFSDAVSIVRPKSDYEIAEYYNRATIFISTSFWEGFGLPALEAMGCGCAVITSDNKGCREYALPDINCLYFEPKNVEDLIDCIQRLVLNRTLRDRLALQGEEDSQKFSWDDSALQFYNIILGKPKCSQQA